jgi:transposase
MSSDPFTPPSRVEVITSVQRRRRWTTAEKVRLVEESMQPGMSVSFVARRAGIAPSQLFAWKCRMLVRDVWLAPSRRGSEGRS